MLSKSYDKLIEEVVRQNYGDKKLFTMQDVMFINKEATNDGGKNYLLNTQKLTTKQYAYKVFIKFLLERQKSNRDVMILLTALKGGGKSSSAIQLSRAWCELLGIRFMPEKHIAYSNSQLARLIDTLPPFSPLIADEAVRFASSEDWNKRENKEMKKKLAQIREKHFLFILCFPLKIGKVEKNYLESFVNYWIELYDRGRAAIFVRDENPVHNPWRLDDFKRIGSYNEFTPRTEVERKLEKHPNFWKSIAIPKVPKPIYSKYKKFRENNIYDDENVKETITKEDLYKAVLIQTLNDIMTNDTQMSMNRILMHVKNNYDITLRRKDMNDMINDSKKLVESMKKSFGGSTKLDEKTVEKFNTVSEEENEDDGTSTNNTETS